MANKGRATPRGGRQPREGRPNRRRTNGRRGARQPRRGRARKSSKVLRLAPSSQYWCKFSSQSGRPWL
eukprot:6469655-Amphidinium_carterae.1